MNRKRVILAALLGLFAICLVYAYFATPRLEKAPPRSASKSKRQTVAKLSPVAQQGASKDRIGFAFLDTEAQEFPGAERDVFRFGQRRPQAADLATKPTVVPTPPPVVDEIPSIEPMVPIEVVQQALGQFTFLGFLDKAGEKTVFLSSEGSLFLAKRGEKFGADLEFTVEDISGNLLQVRHNGREGLIEIPLIEQQKLSASVSAPAHLPPDRTVSQPNPRVFNPGRRLLRPAVPQGSEADLPGTNEEISPGTNEELNPGMNEENNPEGEQDVEPPVEGDDLKGEANGSNQ